MKQLFIRITLFILLIKVKLRIHNVANKPSKIRCNEKAF